MTPLHALSAPAPRIAPLRVVSAPPPRSAPLPTLTRRDAPSVFSGLILALIVLALLLQASFFVGLAGGRVGGPDAVPARAAAAR